MKHYDDMQPRERDAWAAEHVMGWKWRVYNTDVDKRCRVLVPPEQFEPSDEKWGGTEETLISWYFLEGRIYDAFNPSTDAAADYEILKKVRETWDVEQFEKFTAMVEKLTIKKAAEFDSENETAFAFMCGSLDGVLRFIEPGDYSHAAWLALNGG